LIKFLTTDGGTCRRGGGGRTRFTGRTGLANSGIGRSRIGRSRIGRSRIGRSRIGRSGIGRSGIGGNVLARRSRNSRLFG
jgi:hypothetical protein